MEIEHHTVAAKAYGVLSGSNLMNIKTFREAREALVEDAMGRLEEGVVFEIRAAEPCDFGRSRSVCWTDDIAPSDLNFGDFGRLLDAPVFDPLGGFYIHGRFRVPEKSG